MRGLNLKEIMSKSNMNQQGLNIATYGQAYACELEFTCSHTCKLIPLSCRIYRVFGLQELCSTQCDSHLMKGKLLTYDQSHN